MAPLDSIRLTAEEAEEIQALLDDPGEPTRRGQDLLSADPSILLLRQQQEYFEDPY